MRFLATVAICALMLTACGSNDGDKASDTGDAPGSIGGSSKVSSDDDGSGGFLLTSLAKQLTGSLDGGESFEIKDNSVRITMSKAFDESYSFGQCLIATTARDGVEQTAPIVLAYTDQDLDCDTIPE